MNVFDLIEDFYGQDPEWDNVIPRAQVENYLRGKSWQGAEEEELVKLWERLTLFCVYLGNSENFLGDMNREDFIDCVGWCARNVADFQVSAANIGGFLDTLADFYQQLFKKHLVHDTKGPLAAKEKLIMGEVLKVLDAKGNFLPSFDNHNQYATPDLPAKIFLNVGEKMDALLNAIQEFYGGQRFERDFKRASYLYGGMNLSVKDKGMPEWEEFNQGFWDYFLFDYHLLSVDKTPLEFFREEMDRKPNLQNLSKDVLEELIKARLVLFTIEGPPMEDSYNCKDFLTGESYNLVLPMDEPNNTEKMLFMGHIFYNDSMVVNFMKGMKLSEGSLRRLGEVLRRGKEWFAIREGQQVSWRSFLARNALYVRQAAAFIVSYVRISRGEYSSKVTNYEPNFPKVKDKVALLLEKIMPRYSFTAHDVKLALTLWGDFTKVNDKQTRVPEAWAAGVIRCFVELNQVYNYDVDSISQMCYFVPASSIYRCSREIRESLELEKADPRYISEEGMLSLLIEIDAKS